MKKRYFLPTCGLLLLSLTSASFGADSQSDVAKEQRWADQIVDQLIDGEEVWLKVGKHKFLGIYTPAEASAPLGTVVLVHGTGAHPDWPQVIQPLRSGLAESGWQSLSIQMPLLNGTSHTDSLAPGLGPITTCFPGRKQSEVPSLRLTLTFTPCLNTRSSIDSLVKEALQLPHTIKSISGTKGPKE